MIKRNFIIPILLFIVATSVYGQNKEKETTIKREVTLYNPYKPSLNESQKKSFLPELTDTARFRPDFTYNVITIPFMPQYSITPIKAAAIQPDPLTRLYKSYINLGLGNNTSPLAEISITNERSKSGAIGFYGRHFSNNGKVTLDNDIKEFAGLMDNEASLFGKKFFNKAVLGASADILQKTRYAYGYDTSIIGYFPAKKDIRLRYTGMGAKLALSSANLDSSAFSYNFGLRYNYFYNDRNRSRNNAGFTGYMAKSFKGFYVGSGLEYDYYRLPDTLLNHSQFVTSISPFIKKNTSQWEFRLGFKALLERTMQETATFHIYPDIRFGFSIVPSYIGFFTSLTGKFEKNDPLTVISENPFVSPDGSLFTLPGTSHQLVVTGGLKGNTGTGGNYLISASYSLINDMLFFSNIDTASVYGRGNYFAPLSDDVDLLNVHGELGNRINDQISFTASANYYKYTLTKFAYAWNKPEWDAGLGLRYNLRDKVLAGIQLTAEGKRKNVINGMYLNETPQDYKPVIFDMPVHVSLDLNAEYRYSKILSFWAKFNNISYRKYYEWAFYPTQRFNFMLGFTYSL
jgi:hypothetical protein